VNERRTPPAPPSALVRIAKASAASSAAAICSSYDAVDESPAGSPAGDRSGSICDALHGTDANAGGAEVDEAASGGAESECVASGEGLNGFVESVSRMCGRSEDGGGAGGPTTISGGVELVAQKGTRSAAHVQVAVTSSGVSTS
jgi:hypothetical protein